MTDNRLLEAEDVSVRLANGRTLVRGVNFSVASGRAVGIVGETGSGKSVTLRAVMGLLPTGAHAAGFVRLGDHPMIGAPERRLRELRGRHVALVPQQASISLHPVLSIRRQFRQLAHAHGLRDHRAIDARAHGLLQDVGVSDPDRVLSAHVGALSGGLAQRVSIAMALFWRPSILLADEPTTALDLTTQRDILELLRTLLSADDRGLVLVSHDLGVVAALCDTVLVMHNGGVVEAGPVDDILERPQAPYTRMLIDAGLAHPRAGS